VGAGTHGLRDVPGEAADIGAFRTDDPDFCLALLQIQELQLRYRDHPFRDLDLGPPAGHVVEPLPAQRHRRVHRRDLRDLAPKTGQYPGQFLLPASPGDPPGDLALPVKGIGLYAQREYGDILLLAFGNPVKEPRRAAQKHHHNPRRRRVQGAQVADFLLPQGAAKHAHGLRGAHPRRLAKIYDSVQVKSPW